MNKGKFIVFEGMDGTGKTTIIKQLKNYFDENKIDSIITKEPGGSPIGNKLRDIILYNSFANNATDILLFAANRNEHIHRTIKPNVDQGNIVLCDRYIYSSIVYQGLMNNNLERVVKVHELFEINYKPDVLFIFEANPDVTIKRLSNGDKFEMHDKEYFQKVQNHYVEDIIKDHADVENLFLIDANRDLNVVFDDVLNKILDIIS